MLPKLTTHVAASVLALSLATSITSPAPAIAETAAIQAEPAKVRYRTEQIEGLDIAYREAGAPYARRCSCSTAFPPRRICSAT
jgi:hypothetical protein